MCLNSTMRMFFITLWLLKVSGSLPVAARNNGETFNTACSNATVNKTAYIGETVSIICNYSQADKSSIRTFCRHDGNVSCTTIISSRSSKCTRLPRFSLADEKQRGAYEVNISMLTQEDSGRYWCTLERDTSMTCLQDVFLHVLNHDGFKTKPTAETHSKMGQSLTPPQGERNAGRRKGDDDHEVHPGIIAGIVCAAVIVVATLIVVICFRRKIFNSQVCCLSTEKVETVETVETEQKNNVVQNTEGNDGNHQYEEIQIQNKQANTVSPLYSTVNPPAEQLHYASINIHNNSSTENTNGSSISNEILKDAAQTPMETTLYSTVAKIGE